MVVMDLVVSHKLCLYTFPSLAQICDCMALGQPMPEMVFMVTSRPHQKNVLKNNKRKKGQKCSWNFFIHVKVLRGNVAILTYGQ